MWQTLSIRTQLFALTSLILVSLSLATLSLTYYQDTQQRKELAVELSNSLNKSMSQNMLKAVLSGQSDNYSDLSFSLSQFDSLMHVKLYNEQNVGVFKYSRNDQDYSLLEANASSTPKIEDSTLFVKLPLLADGYEFGQVVYIVDMQRLTTQFDQHAMALLFALPFEIIIGFLLANWLSRRYTQPFKTLASAMQKSDPTQNQFPTLRTRSKNEIKDLFDGFNHLMTQIATTTQQMRYQSDHDQLTGLYNRYYIQSQVKQALKENSDHCHTLIRINLDQFKLINDAAGHEAGDELLKMISRGCQNLLPKDAIMARVDSDDFLVFLNHTSEDQGSKHAQTLLNKLQDFRFSWDGQAYSVSASIGLIAFQPFAYTLEELIKASNNALSIAKLAGRNKLHIYHSDDDLSEHFENEIVTAGFIKEALENGPSRFELFAQAIVPLQQPSDQISYEILIRMWDSNNQFIPPDSFLPTAERYQLMADIDGFVLWQFLTQVTQHPEHIARLHSAHVNLAGSSLNHPDFQAKLKQAIDTFDFPWHKLELEITETSAVGNFNQANDFLNWVKQIGIGLALDDFGTGMSSFEYLKSLPFDVVKIDGSFVKDMHDDPSDKAVIRYIQEISALRNQETVAEYIETQADVDTLTEIGITYGQGYFLGKPKPLSEWIQSDHD